MIGWRISRIPTITDSSTACCDLLVCMRKILYSIHAYNTSGAGIELMFHHESDESISAFLFVRAIWDSGLLTTVEKQLTSASYQVEWLDYAACQNLYQSVAHYEPSGRYAVVKTEKIVTTPYLTEGYYYWADPLSHKAENAVSNQTMLFQALQNYTNAYVIFQLQPTVLENYEYDTLQYLSSFLDHRVKNPLPGSFRIPVYEPYALPAYNAYNQIVSQRGQPLFLYNILVFAQNSQGYNLASQILSQIKAESDNVPELQVVSLNGMPVCDNADRYASFVNGYILQHCRDTVIWGGRIAPPNALFRFPFLVTAAEAELYFKLPYDDGKITGISGTAFQSSNELLREDVTDLSNIQFGTSCSNSNVTIGASEGDFAKHALIVGMPGTGKTTFCLNLLTQFNKKGIPFLAIEPTKSEYRALIDAVPDLQVFTPGNNSVSPFVMNPFIPPKGITVEKYIPSLFSAFKAAFSMPSPLDSAFLKAIRASYIRYGWRDYSHADDSDVTPFGLHEFIIVFKDIISQMDYGKEVKGNLQSGGVLRLSNLLDQNRNIWDTVRTIPIVDLLEKPTVIELNAIDNQEQKALIIAMLLINIGAYTKSTQSEGAGLNNVILVDEAHVLLEQQTSQHSLSETADAQGYAVKLVENLIAEIRSYGTSVIIADQRPSAVGRAIVANTDIKVVFRLTEQNEKDIICASADFNESARQQLSQLEMGQAFVYYNKLLKPQQVQTPDIRQREHIRISVSDVEVQKRDNYWRKNEDILKPHLLCTYCRHSGAGCNFKIRADSQYFASLLWDRFSSKITNTEELLLHCNGIPIMLESYFKKYDEEERKQLIICTRIALSRKAAIEKGLMLKPKQLEAILSTAEVRR